MLLFTELTHAIASGGTRGGGDATTARKIELSKEFIFLKSDLKSFLNHLNLSSLKDVAVKKIIEDISARGLNDDINESVYQLSDQCVDEENQTHAASTEIGKRNANICLDLNKLSAQNIVKGELIGLLLHEHAHHFGYKDTEEMHRLISVIANQYSEIRLNNILVTFNKNTLNPSVRAHLTIWTSLYSLNQNHKNFDESGSLPISSLPVLIASSKDLVTFCDQLDQLLVKGRGAKRNKSELMYPFIIASILKDGVSNGENIRWFADQMDSLYTFWNE